MIWLKEASMFYVIMAMLSAAVAGLGSMTSRPAVVVFAGLASVAFSLAGVAEKIADAISFKK